MAPTHSVAAVESLLTFLKGGGLQPGSKPGFGHSLRLSYNTLNKERVSVSDNKKTLTYRYCFAEHATHPSVGLYTALMDELTTDACFIAVSPHPPGVSLQMQTELLVKDHHKKPQEALPKYVDIVNTVTKLGRTVSHTRTDFVCASTQTLLAFSSHVKYMPTGSRLLDFLFTNKFVYRIYGQYLLPQQGDPKLYPKRELRKEVIGSSLEHHGLGRASFHITREHTNPFGAMHGGCHAMVMEQAAEAYAKVELLKENEAPAENKKCTGDSPLVLLEAMHIDFLGAAKGTVDVLCETIGKVDGEPSIHLRVMLMQNEKILSEGKLRYSLLS